MPDIIVQESRPSVTINEQAGVVVISTKGGLPGPAGSGGSPVYLYQTYGISPLIVGQLTETGEFDQVTLDKINNLVSLGIPIEDIGVIVAGSTVPADTLIAASAMITSSMSLGTLTGILQGSDALLNSSLDNGALIGILPVSDALIVSSMESGALTGVLSADSAFISVTSTEGILVDINTISADSALILSAADSGTLVGILNPDSALVTCTADSGVLSIVGTLSADNGLITSIIDNISLIGVLAPDSGVITSTMDGGVLATAATIPAAPVISATAGDSQDTITWSAVSGATSYNIYWTSDGTTPTTSSNKITGVTSPYTHSPLTNGTVYKYAATSVNANGESTLSNVVSVTPAAVSYNMSGFENTLGIWTDMTDYTSSGFGIAAIIGFSSSIKYSGSYSLTATSGRFDDGAATTYDQPVILRSQFATLAPGTISLRAKTGSYPVAITVKVNGVSLGTQNIPLNTSWGLFSWNNTVSGNYPVQIEINTSQTSMNVDELKIPVY